jgi:hypothetical protein
VLPRVRFDGSRDCACASSETRANTLSVPCGHVSPCTLRTLARRANTAPPPRDRSTRRRAAASCGACRRLTRGRQPHRAHSQTRCERTPSHTNTRHAHTNTHRNTSTCPCIAASVIGSGTCVDNALAGVAIILRIAPHARNHTEPPQTRLFLSLGSLCHHLGERTIATHSSPECRRRLDRQIGHDARAARHTRQCAACCRAAAAVDRRRQRLHHATSSPHSLTHTNHHSPAQARRRVRAARRRTSAHRRQGESCQRAAAGQGRRAPTAADRARTLPSTCAARLVADRCGTTTHAVRQHTHTHTPHEAVCVRAICQI